MAQDDLYYRALLPAPIVCLKLALRPFSIGHSILLHRVNSPFILGGAVNEADLITAVLFASSDWKEGSRINQDLWIRLKINLWRRRLKQIDWQAEIIRFNEYVIQGSLFPQVNRKSRDRIPGSAWLWRLKNFLVEVRGLPEASAFNFPLGLAQYEFLAHYETENACEIKNDNDVSFDDFCAEQDRLAVEAAAKAKEVSHA